MLCEREKVVGEAQAAAPADTCIVHGWSAKSIARLPISRPAARAGVTNGTLVGGVSCVGIVLLCLVGTVFAGQNAEIRRSTESIQVPTSVEQDASQVQLRARDTINRYCVTCHNDQLKTANLALDTVDFADPGSHSALWEKVLRKLDTRAMPPLGATRPDEQTYVALTSWLDRQLDMAARARPNPGRTESLHRLNRTEYGNAVRDLLAVEVDVESLLPADNASYGFDNIAGVLKMNQTLMERYLAAARKVSALAVGGRNDVQHDSTTFLMPPSRPQYARVEGLPFGTRGGGLWRYRFPADGEYVIKIKLLCLNTRGGDQNCDGAGGFPEAHEMEVLVDGELVRAFSLPSRPRIEKYNYNRTDLELVKERGDQWEARVAVKAGARDVGVTFVRLPIVTPVQRGLRLQFDKPYTYSTFDKGQQQIYMPHVSEVTIVGPYHAAGVGETASRTQVFTCQPSSREDEVECGTSIIRRLARKAYRRPLTSDDVASLRAFFEEGRHASGFEAGVQRALQAVLVSPKFLFRAEVDPPALPPDSVYRISDLELASRLSFFLWSSIPDDELVSVAARGQLSDPGTLERQVRRLLADERASALTENFFSQWLQLRSLQTVEPNETIFPNFDYSLREAFRRETELFLHSIVSEDRSILKLLTADYTFVNERLAKHYGISTVQGSHFRRVTLADGSSRKGLLGHGSVLTITSHATGTSPVKRGKWVLDNLLGTPPPPPPPNVPPLAESRSTGKVLTMRERMSEHRTNPVCASCHSTIDPIGFALENFDAVGRYRSVDGAAAAPIDASGRLPDGEEFDGVDEFRQKLLARPKLFVSTVTEKLLTYALGRGVESFDMPAIRKVVRDAERADYSMSALIFGIVRSVPFQMRRTAAVAE